MVTKPSFLNAASHVSNRFSLLININNLKLLIPFITMFKRLSPNRNVFNFFDHPATVSKTLLEAPKSFFKCLASLTILMHSKLTTECTAYRAL